MKTCTCCEQEKPLDEFKKDCNAKDGRASYCKACSNAKHAKHRANMTPEQRDKERAYKKRYDRINKKKILARRVARCLEFKAKQEADMNAKHMAWVKAQQEADMKAKQARTETLVADMKAKHARTETLVADTEIKIDQMMKYYAKEIKRDFNTIMFQFNHDLKAYIKDVT